MRILFHQKCETPVNIEMEDNFIAPSLDEDLKKTREALEVAYAGFDNALGADMIDCYIYEINALLKRYKHLTALAAEKQEAPAAISYSDSPVRSLVGQVVS